VETIHDPKRQTMDTNGNSCSICHKVFTRASYVKKHQEKVHGINSYGSYQSLIAEIVELKSKLDTIQENTEKQKERDERIHVKLEEQKERDERIHVKLEEQKERDERIHVKLEEVQNLVQNKTVKNITNNQILNVICVTNHDNYLDMLTDRLGNFDQAIEYIKDCALSDIEGDCKLIEKIYTNQNNELGFSLNQKRSRVTYHDEQQQTVTEPKSTFGRKLANNLQNSYLKSINYLVNRHLDHKNNPNQLLDDYDLMAWNQHIYQLSDTLHQRKIMGQLHLPLH
jgi:hypothetical protein